MITKAELPPKKGYVEVEVNGKRCYKSVYTGTIYEPMDDIPAIKNEYELAEENRILKEQAAALSSYDDFLEECIVEMADIVYAE